jgi:hypothetical protein
MNVPPTRTAARNTPSTLGQATLANTPSASTMQAIANAAWMPKRLASPVQNATDGTAAIPNTIQMTGSCAWIAGVARTIATRNVAVMI